MYLHYRSLFFFNIAQLKYMYDKTIYPANLPVFAQPMSLIYNIKNIIVLYDLQIELCYLLNEISSPKKYPIATKLKGILRYNLTNYEEVLF